MSDEQSEYLLRKYVQRLEELSTPNRHDKRHSDYVHGANTLLEMVGEERIYLVGSTGEKTKIRWSTDSGDTDFIMVSGKLKIPVDNIQPRDDMPAYVWVKCDNLNLDLDGEIAQDGYLCPQIIRTMNSKLFTALRGMYLYVTATNDAIPGRNRTVRSSAIGSKVGLAREEYRNLMIDESYHSLSPKHPKEMKIERSKEFSRYIKQKWRAGQLRKKDEITFRRAMEIVRNMKITRGESKDAGALGSFIVLIQAVLERPPVEDISDIDGDPIVNDLWIEEQNDGDRKVVRATYTGKSSMDFVPALRVIGTLPCMEMFIDRVRGKSWPSQSLAEEICKSDVFIVSRKAPVNPDVDKDFCLSFNLAEIKLSQNLPGTARQVFLVLKSYLKGMIAKKFEDHGRSPKLKTFHLKMTMFWVCEREELSTWAEGNMVDAITKCLAYLFFCLEERTMLQYFMQSNLFVGLEQEDFELLIESIKELLSFPVKSIEQFLAMDDKENSEVWLTQLEVENMTRMKTDYNARTSIDQIEEAILDTLRGVAEGPEYINDKPAIVELASKFIKVFTEAELQRKEVEKPAFLFQCLLSILENYLSCNEDQLECQSQNVKRLIMSSVDYIYRDKNVKVTFND